jgi:hypothetical protein
MLIIGYLILVVKLAFIYLYITQKITQIVNISSKVLYVLFLLKVD